MSGLNPELKRLLHAARESGPDAMVPLGFATRIAALAASEERSEGQGIGPSLAVINWVAVLLLLAGALYWENQRHTPMANQFSQAAQFVAHNLTP